MHQILQYKKKNIYFLISVSYCAIFPIIILLTTISLKLVS